MVAVPLAMSPTQRSPATALLIDFLATPAGAGSGQLRGLLIAHKSSAGSATTDTVYESVAGEAAVSALLGSGMFGTLCARSFFREYPLARLDVIVPPTPAGSVATATITFDDASGSSSDITVAQTVTVTICGRDIQIPWLVGETRVQAATKLVAAINAKSAEFPLAASNTGGTNRVVTLTCSTAGKMGNDITVHVAMTDGAGGSVVASGANASGGTGEMDITNALAAVKTTEYDFFLLVTSNTDVVSNSGSSNPALLSAHMALYGSGAGAFLQQGIVACTSSLTSLKTATAAWNDWLLSVVFARGMQSLPAELLGAEAGARMRERQYFAVKNRIRMAYRAVLYGPVSHVVSDLSTDEVEDALQHGVSPVGYDANGKPWPLRPITCYWQSSGGAADDRILDVTRVDGIFEVAKDLRTFLPDYYKGKSLSPDLQGGDDQLPPDVVEIGEVKETVIARLRTWQGKGILRKDKLDEAVGTPQEPGTLICQIDDTNESMVDLVIPLATIRVLASWSMVFQQAA